MDEAKKEMVKCRCYICKSLVERAKFYDNGNIYSPTDFNNCPICETDISEIPIDLNTVLADCNLNDMHDYIQIPLMDPCPSCGAHLKRSFVISYIEAFTQDTGADAAGQTKTTN